jgi:hypothetical protein
VLRTVGLILGFVALAILAWSVSFVTALYRAIFSGASFKPVLVLLAFFWLPALPAFCYGLSGASTAVQRGARRPEPRPALARVPSTARAHVALPPVDKRLAALRLKDRSAAA